jgi:hypothetical protein
VGAQLHGARERQPALPRRPARPLGDDAVHVERRDGTDRDGAVDGRDREHVARLAVSGRDTEPQPAALADGVAVGAVVGADHRTGQRVDHRTGLRAEPVAQEAGGVAVGDEADVVAVGLVGDAEPAAGASARTCAFVIRRAAARRRRAAPG